MPFAAPVRDLAFALIDLAEIEALKRCEAFADFDLDLVPAVLEGAAALSDNILAPLNAPGDREGVRLENGKVRPASGFKDAYRAFAEGGWNGLSASPEYGGQGLPKALELAVFETIHAANMSFGLCPLLTQGAIEALAAHGTAEQKALYLPKLVSGEWTGTMNLTEPQAGSDLSLVRATARPDGAGAYRITGQKIYITWGDHDLAGNIVHLVLARLPDAPEGVRGISLFLAPKYLPDASGRPGQANALRPGGIEHKLGIHASPTCTMLFEDAKGWLVGQPHQGLAHMFTMMNAARLNVGMQGVGVAERAYQHALAYTLERRQGRTVLARKGVDAPGRIFDHPDVRLALMLMKARIEAARAICLSTAVHADLAEHAPDEARRETSRLRQDLLVPIAKAWSTDMAVDVSSAGVQVFGGMGFVEEAGAAQFYRDARITPIYEGTNGIQAIDLMGRKLGQAGGRAVRDLIADVRLTAAGLAAHRDEWLHAPAARLAAAADAIETATDWMMERKGHAQPDALTGAGAYLRLMGDAVGGWMLCRAARLASDRLAAGEGDREYWRLKISLARIYAEHVLAAASARHAAITMGAADLALVSEEALAGR
jgi:3-(methylthio)propanoyl-CoA dehydrogenase